MTHSAALPCPRALDYWIFGLFSPDFLVDWWVEEDVFEYICLPEEEWWYCLLAIVSFVFPDVLDIPWICFEHVAFGGVGTVRLCMLWEQCVLGWRLLQKLGKAWSIQSCACFFLWEQGKFSASSHIGCWYLLAEDGTAYIPHVKSSWVFSSLFSSSLSRVWLCSFVGIEP